MPDTAKYILLLSTMLASIILPGLAQAARGSSHGSGFTIQCWRNNLGIRECGNTVPPEYSQKRIEVLNAQGQIVKIIQPPKTRAQLEREREQKLQRQAKEAAIKQQEHEDSILLNSYATERDLILARDSNLKAIQADLDISEGNLNMMQSNLADLQTRAGNYERSGHEPPKNLVNRINQTKQQIATKQKAIDQRKGEKAAMEKRYAKDLARFRKLKGLSD